MLSSLPGTRRVGPQPLDAARGRLLHGLVRSLWEASRERGCSAGVTGGCGLAGQRSSRRGDGKETGDSVPGDVVQGGDGCSAGWTWRLWQKRTGGNHILRGLAGT